MDLIYTSKVERPGDRFRKTLRDFSLHALFTVIIIILRWRCPGLGLGITHRHTHQLFAIHASTSGHTHTKHKGRA